MNKEEDAVWAAILQSRQRLTSARQSWGTIKFSAPATQLFLGVLALVENQGWDDMLRVLITCGIVVIVNEVLQLAFAKIELSIATAEAELAYRVDSPFIY